MKEIAILLCMIIVFFAQQIDLMACGNRSNNPSTSAGGNPNCPPCEFGAGSPNNVQAGNHFRKEADISLPTRGFPLEVVRTYDSSRNFDGPFGFGWTSNVHMKIIFSTFSYDNPASSYSEALVLKDDGIMYRYRMNADGITFIKPHGIRDTLIRNADGSFDLTLNQTNSKYHFSSAGLLISMTNDFGAAVVLTYNQGLLHRIDDSTGSGRFIQFGYTSNRITSATDSAGRSVLYSYNGNKLSSVTNPAGRRMDYFYIDGRFGPLLTEIKDEWGRSITQITYNSYTASDPYPWNRVKTYSESGEVYTYEYLDDPWRKYPPVTYLENRTRKRDSAGNAWLFEFDPATGYITRITSPIALQKIRQFTSDGFISVDTVYIDSNTPATTTYSYNTNGSINSITTGGGDEYVQHRYVYADANFPLKPTSIVPYWSDGTTIDRDWQEWRYEYVPPGTSGAGALKKVIRVKSDGTVQTAPVAEYTYNTFGQVVTVTDATGAVTTYSYDPTTGDLLSVTYPKNSDTSANPIYTYTRDPAGGVLSVTDPLGKVTSYTYDPIGRITSVTLPKPTPGSPLNFVTTYSYDNYDVATGWTYILQTDPNNRQTFQYFDQYGQMVKSVDSLGQPTAFTYTKGILTAITDANNNITTYQYDGARQLVKTIFPDLKEETYTYKSNGFLRSKTDRKGQISTYHYDRQFRLRIKCYQPMWPLDTCWSGDPRIDWTYTGQKLTSVVDKSVTPNETWTNVYDTSYRISVARGPVTNDDVSYNSYDAADRLLTMTLQGGGPVVTNTYYQDGSLRTKQWSVISGQFQYNYTLNGQYASVSFPNNQHRDYTYDDQGRLTQIANIHPTPGNLATYSYGYDLDYSTMQNTMLGQRTDLRATVPSQSFSNHQTKYYFDNNYQLRKADYPNVAPLNGEVHQWTYDAIGNRLTNTINSTTQNYSYYKNGSNPLNGQRLQSDSTKTYTYDFNGNVVSDGTYTYTWNREDRLTGISGGGLTITYKYDYLGRRSSKTVGGQTTTYIYNGQDLIAERGGSVAEYLFGPGIDEPLAIYRSSIAYYYNVDGLGSVNLVNDTSGTIQDKYLYDGWGITRSSVTPVANPFVYTARETGEASLLYYRARYYNPNIGRFVSEDPLQNVDGVSLYAYVGNDSVSFKDPTGWARSGGGDVGGRVVCKDGEYQCDFLQKFPDCPPMEDCIKKHEEEHIRWNKEHFPPDYCEKNPGPVTPPPDQLAETECLAYKVSYKCFRTASFRATGNCKRLLQTNEDHSKRKGKENCKKVNIRFP
ncbi:MAG TPA: RHS repeat-associated core domain-containing protein [Acidobacteriota bacterium]|nr:RHS repeat-associated core domain-containing protein [Acidobacteriota bacterium]